MTEKTKPSLDDLVNGVPDPEEQPAEFLEYACKVMMTLTSMAGAGAGTAEHVKAGAWISLALKRAREIRRTQRSRRATGD